MYDKSTEQLNRILNQTSDEEKLQEYLKTLNQSGDSLQIRDYFNEYFAKHDLAVADVIRNSNLSTTYAYQLLNGTRKNPARRKVVALCLGCHMTLPETQRALEIAGLGPLYARDPADAIIIYNINKGNWSVTEINMQLHEKGYELVE